MRCLQELAGTAHAQGQWERAATLFGAAACLRQNATGPGLLAIVWSATQMKKKVRTPGSPEEPSEFDRRVAVLRTELGEEAFAAAWEHGSRMSLEQAVCIALEETEIPTTDRQGL